MVARRVKASRAPLEASILGIASEHVVRAFGAQSAPVRAFAPGFSFAPQAPIVECSSFKRPLVGARTSFWLGVGFGIFVIGVLGYLAVRLFQVALAEAVVVGLTQSL